MPKNTIILTIKNQKCNVKVAEVQKMRKKSLARDEGAVGGEVGYDSFITDPGSGFLMEVTLPMMVARTDDFSKAKSASGAKVQSSRIRFSQ